MDGRRLVAVVVRGGEGQNPAYRPTRPRKPSDLHLYPSDRLGPQWVRSKSEHRIDRVSRPVVRIRPQMAVGVQCLDRAGVTEARLNCLHALPVPDQQACVVVAKRVESGPGREPRRLSRQRWSLHVPKRRSTSRMPEV